MHRVFMRGYTRPGATSLNIHSGVHRTPRMAQAGRTGLRQGGDRVEIDVDQVIDYLGHDLRCFEERTAPRYDNGWLETKQAIFREQKRMETLKVIFHLLDRIEKLEAHRSAGDGAGHHLDTHWHQMSEYTTGAERCWHIERGPEDAEIRRHLKSECLPACPLHLGIRHSR